MTSDLVLITGVTGHVGFGVLVEALKAGYTVRAAIRDSSKAEPILSAKSIKAINPGPRLTFVNVPDITADGAYDEVIKGVKYVIHVASPIPSPDIEAGEFDAKIIVPAVNGTIGILKSAQKETGIKRIVITGSVASIVPAEFCINGSDKTFDETSVAEPVPPPYDQVFVAYSSSKAAAYIATREFITKEEASFDIVTIMPTYVLGGNEVVTDPSKAISGSNGIIFAQVLGISIGQAAGGGTVHLYDVARAHVLALDSKVPGNEHYLLSCGGGESTNLSDAIDIVAKNYPQAVSEGILQNNGVLETVPLKVDGSKAERVFGFKYLNYEEQIKSITEHYLELVGAKAA